MSEVESFGTMANEVLLRIFAYIEPGSAESACLKQTAKQFHALLTFSMEHPPIVYLYAPIYQARYIGLPSTSGLEPAQVKQLVVSAARHDVLENVKYLFDCYKARPYSVLHVAMRTACRCGYLPMVRWLISTGKALVNADFATKEAAECGHLEVLDLLVSKGASIGASDLERACVGGHLHVIQWIRDKRPDLAITTNSVTWAAQNGHLKVLAYLLDNGGDCDNGYATSKAAENGHLEVLDLLVSRGASITTFDLERACAGGRMHIIKWIRAKKPDLPISTNAVSYAAGHGHLEVLEYLLENGGDSNNYNATLKAAENGHLQVLQYLVSRGCDIRFLKREPFVWAAANGHLHVLQWMYELGIVTGAVINDALPFAALRERVHVVEWLVKQGGDVATQDNAAVRNAVSYNHVDMVHWLVARGADVTAKGNSAIQSAAVNANWAMVKYLVSLGADVTAGDNCVVARAAAQGNLEMTKWLIARGADIDAQNGLHRSCAVGAVAEWLKRRN